MAVVDFVVKVATVMVATVMLATVMLATVLTLSSGVQCVSEKTFLFPGTNGSNIQLSYPRSQHGDCMYDATRDLTTCMRNHRYDVISSTWRNNPEDITYIAVNCLEQRVYSSHRTWCVCKDRTMAAHPHRGTQTDSYVFCHLDAIYRDMLTPLTSLEVLDLRSNHLFRVPPGCFDDLRKLKLLDLSENQFKSFLDGLLCHVPSLEFLLMRGLPLHQFPQNVFRCGENFQSSLRVIDLRNSHISNILPGDFIHLGGLGFLDLSYNKITSLPSLPFKGLYALETLDISSNMFTSLPPTFCSGIERIATLRVRHSRMPVFTCSCLSPCSRLTTLDLSHGVISTIEGSPCRFETLRHLNLSWNQISHIPSQLLHNETLLVTLDLSHNQMQLLGAESLHHVTGLTHLDVSYNRMSAIDEDMHLVFLHLQALTDLDLAHNQITSIANGTFRHLKSLSRLDLSGNNLSKVFDKTFTGLSVVRGLLLSRNRINHIENGTFSQLVKMQTLDLSINNISSMNIRLPSSLRIFNLSHNAISRLQLHRGLTDLRELYLQENRIAQMDAQTFHSLPNLRILDLSRNYLYSIADTFFSLVPQLEVVLLQQNRLSLDLSKDVFKGAPGIRTINLSHNQVHGMDDMFESDSLSDVESLYLSHNNITSISDLNTNRHPVSLQALTLDGNQIETISRTAFSRLSHLQYVDLQDNRMTYVPRFHARVGVVFHMKRNPVVCSCDMVWLLQRWLDTEAGQKMSTYDYDVDVCHVYPAMKVQPIRTLSSSQFLCPAPARCPVSCQCFLRPKEAAVYLTICRNNLTEVPSATPADTRILYLDGNRFGSLHRLADRKYKTQSLFLNHSGITSLNENIFSVFIDVLTIDLSYNGIKSLPSKIFQGLERLNEIDVSHNLLTIMPQGLLENLPSLQNIDISYNRIANILPETIVELDILQIFRWIHLSGNPLKCACPNYEFRLWLGRTYNRVYDRRHVTCDGHIVQDVDVDKFQCPSGLSDPLRVVVIILAVCAAIAPGVVLLLWCRGEVLAMCYTRYLPLITWARATPPPCREQRLYDAVVLYDTTDHKCSWWVKNILLPKLRDGRRSFHLYIPQPELQSHDTTITNIQNSYCTIAIVTSSFQQNRFAFECFRHAACREINNGNDHHVIVVTWGFIDKNNLQVPLRNYVEQKKTIAITSLCFWDKLIYKLPDTLRSDLQFVPACPQVNHGAVWEENVL